MTLTTLTPEDFLQKATADQVSYLRELAAELLKVGIIYADAEAKYYTAKEAGTLKDHPEYTAAHQSLAIEYDTIKHLISALQSTIREEREFSGEQT